MVRPFLSYSRSNKYFAERLKSDFTRAGITGWLDLTDIPLDSPSWEEDIKQGINQASHFLLLASPESASSEAVQKERAMALDAQKPILTLHIGGNTDHLPSDWTRRQLMNFRKDYLPPLHNLLQHLNPMCDSLRTLGDLVQNQLLPVTEAAQQLQSGRDEFVVAQKRYRMLPLEPTAYTMTWLVAPAEANLCLPDDVAVHFKFTGANERRDTLPEVMQFLSTRLENLWVVYVEGPRNKETDDFELPMDEKKTHVWEGAVRACARALQSPLVRGRVFHCVFEAPQTLIFALASRLRNMESYRLYQYAYGRKPPYSKVLERNVE